MDSSDSYIFMFEYIDIFIYINGPHLLSANDQLYTIINIVGKYLPKKKVGGRRRGNKGRKKNCCLFLKQQHINLRDGRQLRKQRQIV